MAKPPKSSATNQGDLFQQLERSALAADNAPDLYLAPELLGAMAAAMRQSGMSRDQVVDRMNLCLPADERVTRRQLDAWMARSKEFHKTPAAWLPAFCWATRSILPFQALLQPLLFDVVDRREQLVLGLGQALVEKAQATRKEKELRKQLGD